MALYDPYIPFNYSDFKKQCGNPSQYSLVNPIITSFGFKFLVVDTFHIYDPVSALNAKESPCAADAHALQNYTYYVPQVKDGPPSPPPTNSSCDIAAGNTGACAFTLQISLSSSLVTTQSSRRGTDTLQILIDEGSITGGVLFSTWFLGIFVVGAIGPARKTRIERN